MENNKIQANKNLKDYINTPKDETISKPFQNVLI